MSDIPERLVSAGKSAFSGFSIRVVARTGSTQDVARREASRGTPAGFSCVALEQDSGRGRQGRSWFGRPGESLMVSVLLEVPRPSLTALPLAAGLAVADAVSGLGGDVQIKWPNDIITASGHKLAGILVEAVAGSGLAAAGIGMNLNVGDFPSDVRGANLGTMLGRRICWQEALEALLPRLGRRSLQVCAGGLAAIRDEWMAMAAGFGTPITASTPSGTVTGIAEGIDDDGALLLGTDRGVVRLLAADVHLGAVP